MRTANTQNFARGSMTFAELKSLFARRFPDGVIMPEVDEWKGHPTGRLWVRYRNGGRLFTYGGGRTQIAYKLGLITADERDEKLYGYNPK